MAPLPSQVSAQVSSLGLFIYRRFAIALIVFNVSRSFKTFGIDAFFGDAMISFVRSKVLSKDNAEEEGVLGRAYQPRTQNLTLIPVQAMNQYITQHSEEQLCRELEFCASRSSWGRDNRAGSTWCPELAEHRSYVIVDYSCPHEAGNEIHMAMGKIFYGIVTNRTILWRYRDENSCRDMCNFDGVGRDTCGQCSAANDLADCDSILGRYGWVPSFDKWNQTIGLPAHTPVHPTADVIHHRSNGTAKVVRVAREASIWTGRGIGSIKGALSDDPMVQQIGGKFAEQGMLFLYGMIFNHFFFFREKVLSHRGIYQNETKRRGESFYTFAVHSRHPNVGDSSSIVQERCLRRLLEGTKYHPCIVYIMTDREASLERLKKVSSELGCTPLSAERTENNATLEAAARAEHGPRPGLGFFEDLALITEYARDGFISTRMSPDGKRFMALRSSSWLIQELMEYRSVLERSQKPIQCVS